MPDRYGPYRNFRFRLEIDGVEQAAFSECTIPENSTAPLEYRDGNEPATVRKLTNLNTFGNLVLRGGVTDDSTVLYEWRKEVEDGMVDSARRNVAVVVLDEEGQDGPRWEFREAWPINYNAPDLNATAGEVAIESIEIVHEGMERAA